jgi:hypothetical protein
MFRTHLLSALMVYKAYIRLYVKRTLIKKISSQLNLSNDRLAYMVFLNNLKTVKRTALLLFCSIESTWNVLKNGMGLSVDLNDLSDFQFQKSYFEVFCHVFSNSLLCFVTFLKDLLLWRFNRFVVVFCDVPYNRKIEPLFHYRVLYSN